IPEHWNHRRILTPALVRELHGHGLDVHVWTVNEPDDMHRLLEWGVDGLVTDRPDILADLLTDRFGRPPAPARLRAHAVVEEVPPGWNEDCIPRCPARALLRQDRGGPTVPQEREWRYVGGGASRVGVGPIGRGEYGAEYEGPYAGGFHGY